MQNNVGEIARPRTSMSGAPPIVAIRIAPAASNKKPGAVSRPGAIGAVREFQFHE
jgi:hypothetical protein